MKRLIEILPDLASDIEAALFDIGEYKLARSVAGLTVVDRCRCGDAGCATFYTVEKEKWEGTRLKHIVPGTDDILELDVSDEGIVRVEILDRPEVSKTLRELLP